MSSNYIGSEWLAVCPYDLPIRFLPACRSCEITATAACSERQLSPARTLLLQRHQGMWLDSVIQNSTLSHYKLELSLTVSNPSTRKSLIPHLGKSLPLNSEFSLNLSRINSEFSLSFQIRTHPHENPRYWRPDLEVTLSALIVVTQLPIYRG